MALRKKTMKQAKAKKPGKSRGKAKSLKVVSKSSSKSVDKVVAFKVPKLIVPKKPFKKAEFFNVLAEQVNLSRKEIKGVLEAIKVIAKVHLVKGGPGSLTIPDLCKLTTVTKPATKARKGRNPFTGEEMMFKAKPARKIIKIKPLKKFKMELE